VPPQPSPSIAPARLASTAAPHSRALPRDARTEALQEKYDIEEKKNMTILKSLFCPWCYCWQQMAEVIIQQDLEIAPYGCCATPYVEWAPKPKKAPKAPKAKKEADGAPSVQEIER
jgi:hypothetical protein